MKPHFNRTRTLTMLCVLFAMALCAIGVAAIKRQQQQTSTHLPKVISKVKTLEVVSVTIKGEDEAKTAVIEIRNNSALGIVALSVESGDDKDTSGISTTGFQENDEPPLVILEPYGTIKMNMVLSNMLPDKPLKVSGVMYADGTIEGEGAATKTIQDFKDRAKERGAAKKRGSLHQ